MRTGRTFGAAVAAIALLAAACGEEPARDAPPTTGVPAPPTGEYRPQIDPANFVEGIDHPFLPLEPGTRMTYEGETKEGLERIVVEVTRRTKEIMGVTCVVLHDVVSLDGEVIEDTFDWYAQDRDGNVWYFGEDTKEIENGEVVSTAGSWEAGVDGAQPGIVMLAQPRVGQAYRQEFYEGEAEDMGKVLSLSERAEVPYGSFEGVLQTEDTTPLEPDLVEHKYYAEGVGLVLEVMVAPGSQRIELIQVEKI